MSRDGDDQTKKLIAEKERLDDHIESLEQDISSGGENVEAQKSLVRKLQERIAKFESVKHLQDERDRLLNTIEEKKLSIKENSQQLKSLISDRSYLLHTQDQESYFQELIQALKERGEIPAGIKSQFVEKLIKDQNCICGRSLDPAIDHQCKDAYTAVSEWLNTAGLQQIEDRAIELGARIDNWNDKRSDLQDRLKELTRLAKAEHAEIDRCNTTLKQISKELKDSPLEEVSSLEKKLQEEDNQYSLLREKLGADKRECEKQAEQLKDLEKQLDKLDAQNTKQQLTHRRRDTADTVIKATNAVLKLMDRKWRGSLESQIQKTFKSISVKPYVPKLNKDYSIQLIDTAGGGGNVAFSQGESLVLSFSFISAIIEEARKFSAQKSEVYDSEDTEYPLIMDSPFGALDDTNRSHVASTISKLADQVITMVSKTQWREEVEDAMMPRMGKSYVLTYFSPREDILTSEIRLGANTHSLIKRSTNEHEYTMIKEVPNA